MRPALFLCSALLLGVTGARAENWVHTRDNGGGLPMCFDKDGVKTGADGLTRYAVKMCKDTSAQYYAVDCTKNFKVELLVRIYDVGSTDKYREMTVDDPQSGMAVDAAMACNK
ncbi:MAG TPA: hypothetical protein VNU97_06300 [Rhizomicrobium sp.]|jgi:hypothetical protein|nr:hypothetical protein [Rhizomicrobium sp.]